MSRTIFSEGATHFLLSGASKISTRKQLKTASDWHKIFTFPWGGPLTGKRHGLSPDNIAKVNFAPHGNFLNRASYCQIQRPWQRMKTRPRWRPQSVGAGSTVQMARWRWGDWRVDAGWSGCSGHPRWRGDSAVHQSRTRPSPSARSWMQRWSASGLTSLRGKGKESFGRTG